jgi:hypothetical protein
MLHHLHRPAELLLDPPPTCAGVALVDPDVLEARELLGDPVEQPRDRCPVPDVGRLHNGFEDQAHRVDDDVPLPAAHLLGPSYPRTPPTPEVLTRWLSMLPALG